MIDLYTWPTPNGHKIHIMLEETGLPYRVIPIDIGAGDQFKPGFLKISPNNKMPAMVDADGPGGKPMALAAILLAMPVWGVYSVLLKRRPPQLGGVAFLFVISALGTLLLVPAAVLAPPRWPGTEAALGVLYIAVFASIIAFICWNRGVAIVGANIAGFTLHLLPLFGTVLAILFLGETFQAFHAVGFATILAGVVVATRSTGAQNGKKRGIT
jgi:drug/metabolite transporter (DMT)-like permease